MKNIKRKRLAIAIALGLTVGVAAPASAAYLHGTARDYGYWDGAYYMYYLGHVKDYSSSGRSPACIYTDHHGKSLGGLGSPVDVITGWHACK